MAIKRPSKPLTWKGGIVVGCLAILFAVLILTPLIRGAWDSLHSNR